MKMSRPTRRPSRFWTWARLWVVIGQVPSLHAVYMKFSVTMRPRSRSR
jgi:hypothetical protein